MSSKKAPSPRPIDYAVYALFRVFESGLRLFPMELVWTIGFAFGAFGWAILPKRRRTVTRNLRIAYGNTHTPSQINRLTLQSFCHAGANFMSGFRCTTVKPDELKDRVKIENLHRIHPEEEQHEGAILLLAHMGNWEVLAQLPSIMPDPPAFGTLYRPIDNPLIDKLIRRRRQQQNVKTYSKRDGFFKPTSHLKEGGFLGIIADQRAGRHGVSLPLCGKRTSMTNLPALLHRRSGTPIIPIAMSTTGPARWKLKILEPLEIPEDQRRQTHSTTQITASLYKRIFAESPADVLWLHSYWHVSDRRPLKIDGLQKEDIHDTISQPFRVLIYTDDLEAGHKETCQQLHRLKQYRPDIHVTTAGKHKVSKDIDHHIPCHPDDPPHLTSNAIQAYDRDSTYPIDCALDFTEDGRGGKRLAKAGLERVFCRQGKWLSLSTSFVIDKKGSASITDLVTSLGVPETDVQEETTNKPC